MMKYILLLLAFSTQVFASSSAINPTTVGNTYGFQGTNATVYTPTISAGFGTTSSVDFKYWRYGDRLYVSGSFTDGTIAASLGSFSLPTGLTIDAAKIPLSAATTGGACFHIGEIKFDANAANAPNGPIVACLGTSTTLVYSGGSYTSTFALKPQNVSTQFYSSTTVTVNFNVPITGWSAIGIVNGGASPSGQCNFESHAGYGSTYTTRPYYTTLTNNGGTDMTCSNSTTNGANVTILVAGIYCIQGAHNYNSGSQSSTSIVKNQTSGHATQNSNAFNASSEAIMQSFRGDEGTFPVFWCGHLAVNDVIALVTNANSPGRVYECRWGITRMF